MMRCTFLPRPSSQASQAVPRNRWGRAGALARATRRPRPGQALVELGLISLLLAYLALGTFEFGRAIYTYLTLAHAARDGARVALVTDKTDTNVRAAVKAAAQPLTVDDADIAITRVTGSPDRVELRVTYRFTSPVPLISAFWGGGELPIRRTAVTRYGG